MGAFLFSNLKPIHQKNLTKCEVFLGSEFTSIILNELCFDFSYDT